EGADPQKIAHSGKFITIRATLAAGDIPAPALRLYLLSLRYRDTLIFSEEALRASAAPWRRWAETKQTLDRLLGPAGTAARQGQPDKITDSGLGETERALLDELEGGKSELIAAMDDDFNTSRALAAIDELVRPINVYAHSLGSKPSPVAMSVLRQA